MGVVRLASHVQVDGVELRVAEAGAGQLALEGVDGDVGPALALLALFFPILLSLRAVFGEGLPTLGFLPALLALALARGASHEGDRPERRTPTSVRDERRLDISDGARK